LLIRRASRLGGGLDGLAGRLSITASRLLISRLAGGLWGFRADGGISQGALVLNRRLGAHRVVRNLWEALDGRDSWRNNWGGIDDWWRSLDGGWVLWLSTVTVATVTVTITVLATSLTMAASLSGISGRKSSKKSDSKLHHF